MVFVPIMEHSVTSKSEATTGKGCSVHSGSGMWDSTGLNGERLIAVEV